MVAPDVTGDFSYTVPSSNMTSIIFYFQKKHFARSDIELLEIVGLCGSRFDDPTCRRPDVDISAQSSGTSFPFETKASE